MNRISKKVFIIGLSGVLALSILAVTLVAFTGKSGVNAAPAEQAATPTATPGSSAGSKATNLKNAFIQNFASALGVDQNKLNSAYTSAIDTTVDKAVQDGTITQQQGDKIKNAAKNGFNGNIPALSGLGNKHSPAKLGFANRNQVILEAAYKLLGFNSVQDLKTELQKGNSLATIAKNKGLDQTKFQNDLLAALKAQIDTNGNKQFQNLSNNINSILNRTWAAPKTK